MTREDSDMAIPVTMAAAASSLGVSGSSRSTTAAVAARSGTANWMVVGRADDKDGSTAYHRL